MNVVQEVEMHFQLVNVIDLVIKEIATENYANSVPVGEHKNSIKIIVMVVSD